MLNEINRLISIDPKEGTSEAEKLKLFATLVEKFEKENFPINPPSPIDAIVFRMEERGLKQADLVPFIGPKSKVSEILSGKRKLTLQMIRSLSEGLSIPIELLIEKNSTPVMEDMEMANYPVPFMKKLGWIVGDNEKDLEVSLLSLFKGRGGFLPSPIMFRTTFAGKGSGTFDVYSLYAWTAKVLKEAEEIKNPPEYNPDLITEKFFRALSNLSLANDGPRLAKERLFQYGIILLIVQHLPKTKLDGASFFTKRGNPVVGLTLRFDRIDNFWFTLMHELVHIQLHLKGKDTFFFDEIDLSADNELEREADLNAAEYLIPRKDWVRSPVRRVPSEALIFEFSKIWNIHSAIIAGQIQYESQNYSHFSKLVGQGEVRKQFDFVPIK